MNKTAKRIITMICSIAIMTQCLVTVSAAPGEPPMAPVDDIFFSQQWALGGISISPNGFGGVSSNSSATVSRTVNINAIEAWDMYSGGNREVIVAVIDTGIDYTHSELADSMWINEGEIAGDGIDNDGNGYVDDVYGWNFYDGNNQVYNGDEGDHGTHCVGTIIASKDYEGIAGIVGNSTVKIMNLKIFGESGTRCTPAMVEEAIKYAEANGAVICNISMGMTDRSESLKSTVQESDMLIVCAAGNSTDQRLRNIDRFQSFPAAYEADSILSVASVGQYGYLSETSNYGANSVDIAAPGVEIISTASGGGYTYLSGTSMAAPMVTAVAAMIYSEYENLTLQEVKQVILESATQYSQLEGYIASGGILNAGEAMKLAAELSESKDRANVYSISTVNKLLARNGLMTR